jgi:hypothetical protein
MFEIIFKEKSVRFVMPHGATNYRPGGFFREIGEISEHIGILKLTARTVIQ